MASLIKAPAHLWVVGGVSALWNAFGAFDYLMTQTRNEAYLASFTPEQRAYLDGFPTVMEAAWACGVWGALAGSLLLLARSRHAVTAFIVSLVGLAFTTLYQYGFANAPESLRSGAMVAINAVVWLVAIALLVYSLRMRRAGVLR